MGDVLVNCSGAERNRPNPSPGPNPNANPSPSPNPNPNQVACIEKSFSWWSLALHAFPRARFLAKTDDDSLNNFANLAAILTNPTLVPRGPERSVALYHLLPLGRGRSPSLSLSPTPEP